MIYIYWSDSIEKKQKFILLAYLMKQQFWHVIKILSFFQ